MTPEEYKDAAIEFMSEVEDLLDYLQWNDEQVERFIRTETWLKVATNDPEVSRPETKRPYADPTAKRRSVYVNEANWQALKRLGNGNASAGIRKAVAETDKH